MACTRRDVLHVLRITVTSNVAVLERMNCARTLTPPSRGARSTFFAAAVCCARTTFSPATAVYNPIVSGSRVSPCNATATRVQCDSSPSAATCRTPSDHPRSRIRYASTRGFWFANNIFIDKPCFTRSNIFFFFFESEKKVPRTLDFMLYNIRWSRNGQGCTPFQFSRITYHLSRDFVLSLHIITDTEPECGRTLVTF